MYLLLFLIKIYSPLTTVLTWGRLGNFFEHIPDFNIKNCIYSIEIGLIDSKFQYLISVLKSYYYYTFINTPHPLFQ